MIECRVYKKQDESGEGGMIMAKWRSDEETSMFAIIDCRVVYK